MVVPLVATPTKMNARQGGAEGDFSEPERFLSEWLTIDASRLGVVQMAVSFAGP